MCLPPANSEPQKYFHVLKESADLLQLKDLSMGMSSDYELAIKFKATFLRIGSGILGPRNFKK